MRSRKPLMLLPAAVRIQMVAARLATRNPGADIPRRVIARICRVRGYTVQAVLAPVVAAGHLSCRGIRAIYRAEVSHE